MKRNQLKTAILLGLMATSISMPVWAEDSGGLWQESNVNKIVEGEDEDLNVKTDGVGIGYNGTVNVKDGDLTVTAGGNGILAGYMDNATMNILADKVSITSTGGNGIYATWGDDGIDLPEL